MGGTSGLGVPGCARSDDGVFGHNFDDPLTSRPSSSPELEWPTVEFGLGTRVWSAISLDASSERVLRRLLPSLRWDARETGPASAQGNIFVSTRDGAWTEPAPWPTGRPATAALTSVAGGEVSWWRLPTGGGETHVRLNGDATLLERSRALSIAFEAALGLSGLFSIHAAGVVSPGGAGALFVGPGGSGKTTITLVLVGHGWRYLSDDQVAVDLTDTGVYAHGLRRQLGVVGVDIESLCGPVTPEAVGPHPGHPHKRRVNGDLVFPGRFQASVRPAAVFFPVRGVIGESRLRRLAPAAALERLTRFSPWGSRDASTGGDQLEVLKRLSLQTPAFELLTDSTLPRDTRVVELLKDTLGEAP